MIDLLSIHFLAKFYMLTTFRLVLWFQRWYVFMVHSDCTNSIDAIFKQICYECGAGEETMHKNAQNMHKNRHSPEFHKAIIQLTHPDKTQCSLSFPSKCQTCKNILTLFHNKTKI